MNESEIGNYPNAEVLETVVDYQSRTKTVEKPFYVDNIIEKEVRVPREHIIDVPKEVVVYKKVPEFIEKRVRVEKIIEVIVEVPKEVLVTSYIDVIVEKPVYQE